jgi:hypothetical protein
MTIPLPTNPVLCALIHHDITMAWSVVINQIRPKTSMRLEQGRVCDLKPCFRALIESPIVIHSIGKSTFTSSTLVTFTTRSASILVEKQGELAIWQPHTSSTDGSSALQAICVYCDRQLRVLGPQTASDLRCWLLVLLVGGPWCPWAREKGEGGWRVGEFKSAFFGGQYKSV